MYQPLVPCPSCARHVRFAVDAACPFCNAAVSASLGERVVPASTERLTRAAMFVFATSVAGVAGCASAVDPHHDASSTPQDGLSVAVYGAPSVQPDAGAVGRDAVSGPDDNGGAMADYGAPPSRDGG